MYNLLSFAIALIGTSAAAYQDIKTTEVSDLVSIFLAGSGILIHFLEAFSTNNWSVLYSSVSSGTILLLLGGLMYFTGMWGGADVLLIGSVGYLVPVPPEAFYPVLSEFWPFYVTLVFNLFILGGIYSLVYSFYLSYRRQEIFQDFWQEIEDKRRSLVIKSGLFSLTVFSLSFFLLSRVPGTVFNQVLLKSIIFSLIYPFFSLLFRFLKSVEGNMHQEISVDDLEEGDVLAENIEGEDSFLPEKIRGLMEEEVNKLEESDRERVVIKRGLVFVPIFPLTIVISCSFGDIMYYLIHLLA